MNIIEEPGVFPIIRFIILSEAEGSLTINQGTGSFSHYPVPLDML